MLNACNAPLNNQPTWTIGDGTLRDAMRNLMVISLIAEAARPSAETRSRLLEAINSVTEESIWKKEIRQLKPKSGRIPGSDKQVRQILKRIADPTDNYHTSFKKTFQELFPISESTQKGRLSLFALNSKFSFGSEPPSKRRKLDPQATAMADGDRSAVDVAMKDSDNINSCSRRRKRAASCMLKQIKLVEDSLEWSGNTLSFATIDEEGRSQMHSVEVDLEKMATPEQAKEYVANVKESGALEATESAVGYYGAVVSILASAQYFSQGEYGRATFSTVQSAHILGGLTGVNEIVDQASKRAFNKVITLTAEKVGLEETLERMAELGAERVGESASKALGRLSPVGLFFDGYFIYEDVKELQDKNSPVPTFLKSAHLGLDVTITALSLAVAVAPVSAPFLGPFIIGLTIVRLSIDDFYIDIKDELSQVKGKGFVEHVLAIERGIEEGIVDVLTLKLNQQIKQYERRVANDRELLRNLSDPASFFKVTFQGLDDDGQSVGTVDFTAGILSQYGGFLEVKLNDNGTFTVTLPEVPSEGGYPTQVTRTFSFDHPVTDIVLGVGEVVHPEYIHEEAKLWLFIPVQGYDVIDRLEGHQSSRYGVYTGNDASNNFYALQGSQRRRRSNIRIKDVKKQLKRQTAEECQSPSVGSEITMHLSSYHYDLYGRGGNDKFFLGPQTTQVSGGEDNDLYFIQPSGGKTVIDNFAHDEEMDTLFLNVSFSSISCHRDGWDLLIGYCQTHAIKIKNWFVHGNQEFHRHIYLATKDGVGIEVTKTELNGTQHDVMCAAKSIDRSNSKSPQTLVLTGHFSEVTQVVGSNYSDMIVGNEKPNTLRGGFGNDYLKGGNGTDIYLIKKGDDMTTIDNYALDNEEDTLIFGIPYLDIAVGNDPSRPEDLVMYDSRNAPETQVKLMSWFDGLQWQHMVFISKDYIRFTVSENENGTPTKHPLTVDLSEYRYGVRLDLQNPKGSINITINSEIINEVSLILDSPNNDILIGNSLGNFMGCSGGTDFLQGNQGKDTYVIDPTCSSVTINNFDESQEYDLMLLRFTSHQIHLLPYSAMSSDLTIRCEISNNQAMEVHLKDWFLSAQHQHLMLKTVDKISAFLPRNENEFNSSQGEILPFEIESDQDCGGQLTVVNLTTPRYSYVERFKAKTDACSYTVVGNSLNNYIDPGPDSPYGHQQLTGGNGTDTYVMGHRYGIFNTIDNFAADEQVDHLQFDVVFHDIKFAHVASTDVSLTSLSRNDSVKVTILRYCEGELYQHLLVHSIDGITFKVQCESPHIHVIIVDFSVSPFSQTISAEGEASFQDVRVIIGSKTAENNIQSGKNTTKVVGGHMNDNITGGPGEEDLIGMTGDDWIHGKDGNDAIYGGEGNDFLCGGPGNDIIYGGQGADVINGGSGSDTLIFSGWNFTGVEVNLQVGLGWGADAEGDTYVFIERLTGSAYDDILVGNDENNIIQGSGGDDFIAPAGGYDILLGGTGSDFYYMDGAFGNKMINNFATDSALDLIILNKTLQEQICYFFLGDDLEVNIDFSVNTSEAVTRISLAEDFLQITLPFWLKNTTYQHVAFILSDGVMVPETFTETDRQVQPMLNQMLHEDFLKITSTSEHAVCLRFNISTSMGFHSHMNLEYVHIDHDSTSYHHLDPISHQNICLGNLTAGVEHKFTVMLTSCNLTVALSPLVFDITKPSPPGDLVSNVSIDGFQLLWSPPDSETNPHVSEYEYIVTIWSEEHTGELFNFVTNLTTFSIHDLIPETVYSASVASKINHTSGKFTSPLTVTTPQNTCWGFERNEAGNILALVDCEKGYELEDNSSFKVICNDSVTQIPLCVPIPCLLPSVSDANHVQGTSNPVHGDKVTWNCHHGYEFSQGVTIFSSTCQEGQWTPAPQSCQEKPKCSGAIAPDNGYVSATTAYVGESVTFSCDAGYELEGSEQMTCSVVVLTATRTQWRWTVNTAQCIPQECPELLPQVYGYYHSEGTHYTGDQVLLTCYSGYYVQDSLRSPNQVILNCLGGYWQPKQEVCKSIIEVTGITDYILRAVGTVSYVPSAWSARLVDSSLFGMACELMVHQNVVGEKVRWSWGVWSGLLQCPRQPQIILGPNQYEGIVSVGTTNGNEYVCVKETASASTICSALGYSQYTTSVYSSAIGIKTSRTASNGLIVSNQETCYHRIRCRHFCDYLYLQNGNSCSYNLEGNTCYFSCHAGYALVGSSTRVCTSTGWTGSHPFCDGEQWKTDVERESRNSGSSHGNLAIHIRDYLRDKYSGVYWVVVVYDELYGFEAHTVRGQYYHLFRHYGHNIVVGRVVSPWWSYQPNDLASSFWSAYEPSTYTTGWWSTTTHFHAENTVDETWNNLQGDGLSPVMLHMFRSASYGYASYCDGRCKHFTLPNGYGYATVIAEDR